MTTERLFSVAFLGIGAYFTLLVAFGALRYLEFRRLRPTALLTWRARPGAQLPLLLSLGVLAAGIAVLNASMRRPLHHVWGQGVMAVYFIVTVPLLARIPLGLYRDGIWAESGFLPYLRIARLAFREGPEIVLMLLPRRGRSARLPIPPAEYGAVRKLLQEKAREGVLNVDAAILGL